MIPRRQASIVIALACAALQMDAVPAATARFDDVRLQPPVHGDAARGATKAAVCAACHGAQGIAVAPTFPNLAGQSQTYLYVQLRAFKDGARDNAVMKPLASALSDHDMRDIAAHFASLPGKAGSVADVQSASRGDTLFHDGDPAKGIPPCQGCHGPDARGPRPDPASAALQPAWRTFPALAGQNAPYVLEQLKAFHDGTRAGTSNDRVMQGVARNLDDGDMQALAAYIASQ
ncbi:MAG TPA: c-type cytochrome [Rhodanobacteraceae bacterium]|nr:c-type cytochrome [Rhodanobacteraceae bacterium]